MSSHGPARLGGPAGPEGSAGLNTAGLGTRGFGLSVLRRSGGLNYIPMMESLVWSRPHETERDRTVHALELNELFNDSIRYLMLLTAAIFSMVLALSAALQTVTNAHLTMLQVRLRGFGLSLRLGLRP